MAEGGVGPTYRMLGRDTWHSFQIPRGIFVTDIPNNVLELKKVILNEFHVLKRFLLISLCDQPVHVTLESDLQEQIAFQLKNENLDSDEESSSDPSSGTFLADDFNELFNNVDLVDGVILQPRQVQQVILVFQPKEPSARQQQMALRPDSNTSSSSVPILPQGLHRNVLGEQPTPSLSDCRDLSFRIQGKIFLSAAMLGEGGEHLSSPLRDGSQMTQQHIVAHFHAIVYRPVLKADIADLVFDDCVPRGVFVKDFSIWNLSEIPCSFRLRIDGRVQALELTDYDSCLPISQGEIPSCAHKRIRVTYHPERVGEFDCGILLENKFDARNSSVVPIHCVVSSEHREEGILVTGLAEEGVVDFGDCYSDNVTSKLILLKNVTKENLHVALSTDMQHSGDCVIFHLQTELDISGRENQNLNHLERPSPLLPTQPIHEIDGDVSMSRKHAVEELLLESGQERGLLLSFLPSPDTSDDLRSLRLQRRPFRVSLKCGEGGKQRYSKIIQCKARVCTSMVKVSTSELNLGDCNIGSFKTSSVEILNLSDLPALVTAYVTSTVLSFTSKAEHVTIPPRQAYELEIKSVPIRVNSHYRKQIRIENLFNKRNVQLFEVRANYQDRHHVLLHSLFYRLGTPSNSNFLAFDSVVVNNPSTRTLVVENITAASLKLGFSTSIPGELFVYRLKERELVQQLQQPPALETLLVEENEEDSQENRRRAHVASANREKLLETLEGSQPRLSDSVVLNSSLFETSESGGRGRLSSHAIPVKDKKTRMRMSLDLAHSSGYKEEGEKVAPSSYEPSSKVSAKMDSLNGDGSAITSHANSGEDHSRRLTMKRVKSSAMLRVEETPNKEESQSAGRREGALIEALKRVGEVSLTSSLLAEEGTEKEHVEAQIRTRELVLRTLEEVPHSLSPAKQVDLRQGEKVVLYVVLVVNGVTRPSIQGKLRKLTAKVNIELVEYDRSIVESLEAGFLGTSLEVELLTREVPVQMKVCRSLHSLAQKNINFGHMLTNEHRAKTLVLNNLSDVPLLYKIRKTGSIASGDLHIIDGRVGLVRPHCSREVNFVFQPSLAGNFREKLTINNVYDPSSDQVVILKATVSRAETFEISTAFLEMGPSLVGEWSSPQPLIVTNISKQSREFVLKASDIAEAENNSRGIWGQAFMEVFPRLSFQLKDKVVMNKMEATPEQEAIEALERKFTAYERKGKVEKAAKVRKQIEQLLSQSQSQGSKVQESESDTRNGSKTMAISLEYREESRDKNAGRTGDKNVPRSHQATAPFVENKGEISRQGNALQLGMFGIDHSKGAGGQPKPCEGSISFVVKPNESQVVLVKCLHSFMEEPNGIQRVEGNFLAYESKNQDVMKTVAFGATVFADSIMRDRVAAGDQIPEVHGAVNPLVKVSMASPSISFSEQSSAPTSPHTVKIPGGLSPLNPFSPEVGSPRSLSDFVGPPSPLQCPPSPLPLSHNDLIPHSLLSSLDAASASEIWARQRILSWGLGQAEAADDEGLNYVPSEISSTAGSRPESSTGIDQFNHIFGIEINQPGRQPLPSSVGNDQVVGTDEQFYDNDRFLDLSSAAAMARSMASRVHLGTNVGHFGELVLEDTLEGGVALAGSLTLTSFSYQDEWITVQLSWDSNISDSQLWIRELNQNVRESVGGDAAMEGSILKNLGQNREVSPSKQLPWLSPEAMVDIVGSSYSPSVDRMVCVANFCLKAESIVSLTLRIPDSGRAVDSFAVQTNSSLWGMETHSQGEESMGFSAVGMLTLKAERVKAGREREQGEGEGRENREGAMKQVILRLKKPEKMLSVQPSEILFPESDLFTELQSEFFIRNRCGIPLDFRIRVGGVVGAISTASIGQREKREDESENAMQESNYLAPFSAPEVLFPTPSIGHIDPFGTVKVELKGNPVKPGRQTYNLLIRSQICTKETIIPVVMLPRKVPCVRFPDLAENNSLDMGYCYLNGPDTRKIVPLRLENLREEPISLTFRSNLAKQVSLCEDEKGENRIDEAVVQGKALRVFYMCLRPSGEPAVYENGQCREIIGGMRILARPLGVMEGGGETHSREMPMEEVTVKFWAMVGKSLMRVSSSFIDLGRVQEVGGNVSGNFTVSNPSSNMPLDISVRANLATLSLEKIRLTGRDSSPSEAGRMQPEVAIEYCLPIIQYGLIQDKVIISNLSSPGHDTEVMIQLFVDDCSVQVDVKKETPTRPEKSEFLLKEIVDSSGEGLIENDLSDSSKPKSRSSITSCDDGGHTTTEDSGVADSTERQDVKLEAVPLVDLGVICISATPKGPGFASCCHPSMKDSGEYRIADTVPYHTSFELVSHVSEPMNILPFSNLPLRVSPEMNMDHPLDILEETGKPLDAEVSEEIFGIVNAYVAAAVECSQKYECCGSGFVLLPYSRLTIYVRYCQGKERMSATQHSKLRLGKVCPFKGSLLLVNMKPPNFLNFLEASNGSVTQHAVGGKLLDMTNNVTGGDATSTCMETLEVVHSKNSSKSSDFYGRVVEVLEVKGLLGISWGELEKSKVDLGKIGYANLWGDVQFEVKIRNISCTEVVCCLENLQEPFSVVSSWNCTTSGEGGREGGEAFLGRIAPGSMATVKLMLETTKLEHTKEAGKRKWMIPFRNCSNPGNFMELEVEAEMTVCMLRFNGLMERALLLPPLTIPSPPSAPLCAESFIVENLAQDSLGIALEVRTLPVAEGIVKLEVTSRNNTPFLRELNLCPNGRMEIVLRARPISDSAPSGCKVQHTNFFSSQHGENFGRIGISRSRSRPNSRPRSFSDSSAMADGMEARAAVAAAAAGGVREREGVETLGERVGEVTRNAILGDETSREVEKERQRSGERERERERGGSVGSTLGYRVKRGGGDAGEEHEGGLFSNETSSRTDSQEISSLSGTLCIGHIFVYSSPHMPHCIPVHCLIFQGPSFDVSPHTLHLQAQVASVEDEDALHTSVQSHMDFLQMQNENGEADSDGCGQTFVVRNFLAFQTLNFKLEVVQETLPAGLKLSIRTDKEQQVSTCADSVQDVGISLFSGTISPHGTAEVQVKAKHWPPTQLEKLLEQSSEIDSLTTVVRTCKISVTDYARMGREGSVQSVLVRVVPFLNRSLSLRQMLSNSEGEILITTPRAVQPGEKVSGMNSNGNNSSNSNSGQKQLTLLPASLPTQNSKLPRSTSPVELRRPPILLLRGCTPVGSSNLCYEFNLGQQNLSTSGVRWEFAVVGDENRTTEFRLHTLNPGDSHWLTISSFGAVLEAKQQEVVQLTFSTRQMGVFSTHLIVENRNNSEDLKTVRLSLEVTAPRNIWPDANGKPLFHVLVQGSRDESAEIDMGEVHYHFWYRNRSFVVVNDAPVAMEFLLGSTLNPAEETELNFSLSNASLKRFSSLTIEAKSSMRVWIHFCPEPSLEPSLSLSLREDTSDQLQASILVNCRLVKDYQRSIPFKAKCRYPQIGISRTDIVFSTRRPTGPPPPPIEGETDTRNVRTVQSLPSIDLPSFSNFEDSERDFSTSIENSRHIGNGNSRIDSMGFFPKGSVSLPPSLPPSLSSPLPAPILRGDSLQGQAEIELYPPMQSVMLTNLYSQRDLEYVVKNDSFFFVAIVPDVPSIPGEQAEGETDSDLRNFLNQEHGTGRADRTELDSSCHMIVVKPKLDALRAHKAMILKQKYVEEHMTIYNKRNPCEKYTINLRITAGHLRNFFAAPGPKSSHPFSGLELSITKFLSSFNAFTTQYFPDLCRPPVGPTNSKLSGNSGKVSSKFSIQTLNLSNISSTETGHGDSVNMGEREAVGFPYAVLHVLELKLEELFRSTEGCQVYSALYFDFHYLTDELVFYSLKERWSRDGGALELTSTQLAKLLYCVLFQTQVFTFCLESCLLFGASRTEAVEGNMETDIELRRERSARQYEGEETVSPISRGKGRNHGVPGGTGGRGDWRVMLREGEPECVPKSSFKILEEWGAQLKHFVSYFSDLRDDLVHLRELDEKVQRAVVMCRRSLSGSN